MAEFRKYNKEQEEEEQKNRSKKGKKASKRKPTNPVPNAVFDVKGRAENFLKVLNSGEDCISCLDLPRTCGDAPGVVG